MSSHSDHSGIAGESATETTGSSDREPVRTDGVDYGRTRPDEPSDTHHVSSQRVRINTLEAEVDLLEAERESLTNEVTALESEVEELEDEVASLERTIECTETERQQLINQYEQIIAEKERAYQELQRELDATPSDRTIRLPTFVRQLRTKIAQLKRFSRDS